MGSEPAAAEPEAANGGEHGERSASAERRDSERGIARAIPSELPPTPTIFATAIITTSDAAPITTNANTSDTAPITTNATASDAATITTTITASDAATITTTTCRAIAAGPATDTSKWK